VEIDDWTIKTKEIQALAISLKSKSLGYKSLSSIELFQYISYKHLKKAASMQMKRK
jgi:hypothetical protein